MLDKLAVISRRDLLTAMRHRLGFWLRGISIVAELAAFYFLAHAVGPGFRPDGVAYYQFLLVGTGLCAFFVTGANACVNGIHEAQISGTMEVLFITPTPAAEIAFLSAFSTFAARTLHLAFYLAAGFLLFQAAPSNPNLMGCAIVYVLSLLVAVSIGIAAAAVQLVARKGGTVVALGAALASFLSGMMFPVSALPPPLQTLAALMPLTHSLNGMRLALLRGAAFGDLAGPIAALAVYAMLLLPASLHLFSRALRQARQQGTLSLY